MELGVFVWLIESSKDRVIWEGRVVRIDKVGKWGFWVGFGR